MPRWIDPRKVIDNPCREIQFIPLDEQTVEFLEARDRAWDEVVKQICLGLGISPTVLGLKEDCMAENTKPTHTV